MSERQVVDWAWAARATFPERGGSFHLKPYPGAHPLSVSLLRRLSRAYAESLAGRESLHATALLSPAGGALALLGESGEGKSTMASRLLARGFELLTDDVLPVRVDGERAVVSCGDPVLKLTPGSLKRARKIDGPRAFDPNFKKWIVRRKPAAKEATLSALVLLRRGMAKRPRLERVAGAEAALILQASVYNEMLRPRRVLARQLEVCAEVARRVPVFRLYYPDGFSKLDRAAGLLEAL